MATTRDVTDSSAVDVITGYSAADEARDVEAMLRFFADDADVTAGPGTFHGKDAIARFLRWDVGLSPAVRRRDAGVGIVVSGPVVVTGNKIEASCEGIPYEHPIATIDELSEEGNKIQHMRADYDKLAIDRQVTSRLPGLKGSIPKGIVNDLVRQGEKGMRK